MSRSGKSPEDTKHPRGMKRTRSGTDIAPFVEDYRPYTSGILQRYLLHKHQDDHKTHWELYYKQNTVNGYKDRHYILREFVELGAAIKKAESSKGEGDQFSWMEAGCGVGNAFLPIFSEYGHLPEWEHMLGFDISSVAVGLLEKKIDALDNKCLQQKVKLIPLDPCEVEVHTSPLFKEVEPVQFVSMVFVLCSIPVEKHELVLRRVAACMKKGGVFFFRDYAVSDHAEERFRNRKESNPLAAVKSDNNTFTRTNGTLSHFFSVEEVTALFTKVGFEVVQVGEVEREVQNTKLNLNLERKFVQGRFVLKE
ncbi:hypothetical protein AGDE_01667 [Angomonas deanei]|nr:hypothetical protein AGDE_01667 [Angomonas deanei]|eukprot:EPY42256.1 hypothetical protein AGDE_01667 [Angomonas deanei]